MKMDMPFPVLKYSQKWRRFWVLSYEGKYKVERYL